MKKTIIYTILSAGLAIAACSCTRDEITYAPFDDETLFTPISTKVDDLDEEIPYFPVLGEDEDTKATGTNLTGIIKGMFGAATGKKIHSIAGTYWSTDQNGDKVRLSGKVFLPAKGDVKGIILVSHFTICADYECPSRAFQLEGILALDGYAIVMPDYIGYGATADRPHPYLCSFLTAQNIVDMLDAVVPYLEKIGREPEDKDLYLMGYSQGGATTMAVQRLLETEYSTKYTIRRNFAGAGPYDIAATYDESIAMDKTGIPCAIPMIIIGMNVGENLGLDYSVYFQKDLLKNYEEWIFSKKYTTMELKKLMGVTQLSKLMTDIAMQKRDANTIKLYNAMLHNSILTGWVPEAPVYMFHSQDDDTVPFLNSQHMKDRFKYCNVEYNFGHYGSHQSGCVRFIETVHELIK